MCNRLARRIDHLKGCVHFQRAIFSPRYTEITYLEEESSKYTITRNRMWLNIHFPSQNDSSTIIKRGGERVHRIDGKTTSHCFETFVSMVIYRSTERNRSSFVICQRRGGQPHVEYNCTPSTRLPRFPFFQREKERLDPFNALLSGRSSIVTAGVSRRGNPFQTVYYLSSGKRKRLENLLPAEISFHHSSREIQPGYWLDTAAAILIFGGIGSFR